MSNATSSVARAATKLVATLGLLTLATPAWAGRGSGPAAIQSAIQSGSVDAISAELERSERLICGACVDMVRPLVDHPDARIRRVASWWLARRGLRSELFVQMAYRLATPDSVKARNAADVLGSLRSHQAVVPLGAALNNPVFSVEARVAMAAGLGRIGEPAGAVALKQAMTALEAPVRAAAVAALRELRGPIDVTAAVALLKDSDETVRGEAIYTIGAGRGRGLPAASLHATARALSGLVERDRSATVRRKAAWALGEVGAPATLAAHPLRTASRTDRDPAVRSISIAALSKLAL